jgi:hypothetical protein
MTAPPESPYRTLKVSARITACALIAGACLAGWRPQTPILSELMTGLSTASAVLLLLYWPGRFLVRLSGAEIFTGSAGRCVLSAVLSLAVSPPALDLIWRLTHRAWVVLGLWWMILCGLALWAGRRKLPACRDRKARPLFEHRATRKFALLLGTWLACCLVFTYWPDHRAGFPVPANPHDYVKHHAVLYSLQSGGLPLGNPFCADAADQPYYYYHYFYLLPATARLWAAGGLGIAAAFSFFGAATALACVALVYMLTKRLTGGDAPAAFAALTASLVGGWDVIPLALQHKAVITLDAWADVPFRIHNLYTNFAWCPQHVHGLVVVLSAVLLLSAAPRARWWLVIGPILAASLAGTTVYLAFAVLGGLGLYAALDLLETKPPTTTRRRRLGAWLLVGLGGALLMAPQLSGYWEMSARYGDNLTTTWPRNSFALLGKLVSPGPLANLLDLPIMLLLEFGARFLACVLVGRAIYRRLWSDPGARLLMISSLVGLALFVVVRSGVHRFDYGFKIALFPLKALSAVLCGCLLGTATAPARVWNPLGWRLRDDYRGRLRKAIGGLLVVAVLGGLPVGLYEAPLAAAHRFVRPPDSWSAEKQAYRYVREQLPDEAVVQSYTGASRARLVQLASRQWGVLDPADSDVGVWRPPRAALLGNALRDVNQAAQTASPSEAYRLFQAHGITHVFVGLEERKHWAHLDKFDHARYFKPVFRDENTAVYALAREASVARSVGR